MNGRTADGRFSKGFVPPNRKKPVWKVCPKCGEAFSVKPSLARVVCCSRHCASLGRAGANRGRKFGPSPKRGVPMSEITKAKLRISCSRVVGPEHHNWRNGNRSARKKQMARYKYREWRKSVFERDNFSCCECGVRGVFLHADHIKPWSLFPKLRFSICNGRTLCVPCHCKTDSFPKQLVPKELRF